MGMSDRQFDSYQARLIKNLKDALTLGQTHEQLKEEMKKLIEELERELKRP
jgi:hypothetical protein